MRVEVIVPYRGGCPYREAAWEWIRTRYAERHPDWQVTLAPAPPGPWCKGAAANLAVEASDADIIILADADCWTTGLAAAVAHVQAGAAWSIPHYMVHRLTEQATRNVLSGSLDTAVEQPPYPGIVGGGMIVAPREAFLSVPMDARFKGWGQEDESYGWALTCLLGKTIRQLDDLIHLFHPPQERIDRVHGSREGWALRRRYAKARHDPTLMRSLVEEGRLVASDAHQPAVCADPAVTLG